jgi:hypothetical protein
MLGELPSLRERIWNRINNNPVAVAVGILVIVAGGSATLWSQFQQIRSGLQKEAIEIPDITSPALTKSLSGLPPLIDRATGATIFPGGAIVRLPIARTGVSSSAFSLLGIAVRVDYKSGSRQELAYRIPESSLHPLGELPAREFELVLAGHNVKADWIVYRDGHAARISASPSNLLEVENHAPLYSNVEGKSADPYVFRIHPHEEGFYEVTFELSYTIGKEAHISRTKAVSIYYSE